jgi:hypothetical protein
MHAGPREKAIAHMICHMIFVAAGTLSFGIVAERIVTLKR